MPWNSRVRRKGRLLSKLALLCLPLIPLAEIAASGQGANDPPPDTPLPCSTYFLELLKPRARFREILSSADQADIVKNLGTASPPSLHVGNLPETLRTWRPPPNLLRLKVSIPGDPQDSYLLLLENLKKRADVYMLDDPIRTLKYKRSSADGKVMELNDFLGARFFYKAGSLSKTELELNRISYSEGASYFTEDDRLGNFVVPRTAERLADTEELAAIMAISQEQVSATLRGTDSTALFRANLYMVHRLKTNKLLTLSDVKNLNLLASSESVEDSLRPYLGVFRGERKVFNLGEKKVEVDNRFIESSLGPALNYLPASQVSQAMTELLTMVNQIGVQSKLIDIAKLTQKYISIHPFIDGNGRTAKILLDYMLLKAHLPPIPHDPLLTGTFLFSTPADLETCFLKAYKKSGIVSPRD